MLLFLRGVWSVWITLTRHSQNQRRSSLLGYILMLFVGNYRDRQADFILRAGIHQRFSAGLIQCPVGSQAHAGRWHAGFGTRCQQPPVSASRCPICSPAQAAWKEGGWGGQEAGLPSLWQTGSGFCSSLPLRSWLGLRFFDCGARHSPKKMFGENSFHLQGHGNLSVWCYLCNL